MIIFLTFQLLLLLAGCGLVAAVFVGHDHSQSDGQEARRGRQDDKVQGVINFSGCEEDPDTGLCCVDKEETVTTIKKDPILECSHKNIEQ